MSRSLVSSRTMLVLVKGMRGQKRLPGLGVEQADTFCSKPTGPTGKTKQSASSGSRTRVTCLEGKYDNHYTNEADIMNIRLLSVHIA